MISRVWHGWTSHAHADAYEKFLRDEMLPGIHRVRGFKGAQVLRRDAGDEVEFVTITRFESIAAVKEFAGKDYAGAVIEPKAREWLVRHDAKSVHYEIAVAIE